MPTYVYECSACAKIFEVDQRITEDALKDCACGSKGSLKRLIQPVAVAFKGAGFHINDYASTKPQAESAEKPAEADKPAAPATAGEVKAGDTNGEAPKAEAPKAEAPAPKPEAPSSKPSAAE